MDENVINIIISSFVGAITSLLSLYISSKFKKKEYTHSIQNKTQINVLERLYEYSVELEHLTNLIFKFFKNKYKSPYNSKQIEKWEKCYKEMRQYYSSKKYIIPKKIINTVDLSLNDFNNLSEGLNIQKKINYLFEDTSPEIWSYELIKGCEEEYKLLNKKLEHYDSEKMFKQSIKQIQEIEISIEKYFNKNN